MGAKSKIEWTDATWTPIRARFWEIQVDGSGKARIGWHCEHVSPGCVNCYAETMNRRLGTGLDFKPGNLYRAKCKGYVNGESKLFLDEKMLEAPLRWRRPRRVFVCSMTDLFADFVPDEWIDRVFAVMALAPQHTFQVLTKRSARMRAYCQNPETPARVWRAAGEIMDTLWALTAQGAAWGGETPWPLKQVSLGVSVEDQIRAGERIPDLLWTPAAHRFLSAEPLLSSLDLTRIDIDGYSEVDPLTQRTWAEEWEQWRHTEPTELEALESFLDWFGVAEMPSGLMHAVVDLVIVGGESGPGARPMHPDWARSIRDQCSGAGVRFFFKQRGEWAQMPCDEAPPSAREHVFPDGTCVYRVGKSRAGRTLDGVIHD